MISLLAILIAYLIGSIPFGYLIVRATGGGDVRKTGSGGTGATNVSRRAGKAAGILTLVLDALKGMIAVVAARVVLSNGSTASAKWFVAAAAVAAIAGHVFPVWLGFRGGKGVATAVGVFFMFAPFALLCAGVVFLIVVLITRYVSLASLTSVLLIPLFLAVQKVFVQPRADIRPALTAAILIALLIVFAHRGNIQRLLRGTEPKFS
jgi:acyl phosphate:glycerol-3-phosphate acyltransferase